MITRLQDLQKKNYETQQKNDQLREENEKNQSQNRSPSIKNDQQSQKNQLLERKIDHLKYEINRLKMLNNGNGVSCPVCLENFDTDVHQAYALSCSHMICSGCLKPALDPWPGRLITWAGREVMATERRNNAHIIPDQNHPSKRCPVCRQPVTTKLKKICLNS